MAGRGSGKKAEVQPKVDAEVVVQAVTDEGDSGAITSASLVPNKKPVAGPDLCKGRFRVVGGNSAYGGKGYLTGCEYDCAEVEQTVLDKWQSQGRIVMVKGD